MIIAETPRLTIREFSAGDAPFILELVNTPSWLKYIGDRNIRSVEDAEKYLVNGPMKSYLKNGFGLSLVSLKEGNLPVGMCGLIRRDNLEDVDIGFAFLPAHERKGYGLESAQAMLAYAESAGLKRVVAITLPENEPSIMLLKKLDMRFEKMIRFANEDKELMLFSIEFEK